MAVLENHPTSFQDIIPEDGVDAELQKMAEEATQEPEFINTITDARANRTTEVFNDQATEPEGKLAGQTDPVQEAREDVHEALQTAIPAKNPESVIHKNQNPDTLDSTGVVGA